MGRVVSWFENLGPINVGLFFQIRTLPGAGVHLLADLLDLQGARRQMCSHESKLAVNLSVAYLLPARSCPLRSRACFFACRQGGHRLGCS